MKKKILITLASLFALISAVSAKVTLPNILGDNMILQQKENVKIWGKSTALEKEIFVQCSWNNKRYKSYVQRDGNWQVEVQTPKFGGPYQIIIDDGDILNINNILIGDVYFCSGQSNMEMPLAGWGKINNYEEEIKAANYPNIRILQAIKSTSNHPTEDISLDGQGWGAVTSESIAKFSATAYFFAKEIYAHTGVPIGLIHSSWGGTIIESWISKEGLSSFSQYASMIDKITRPQAKEMYEHDLAIWNDKANKSDEIYRLNNGKWYLHNDFSTWETSKVPNYFDTELFPKLDGVVYYAKEIAIPQDWLGKDIKLILGAIDDNDITYVNAVRVGQTEGYNVNRVYNISADNNNREVMTILIRVFDGAGEGGVYGGGEMPRLENSLGQTISLTGDWRVKIGYDFKQLPPRPIAMDGPNRPTVLFNGMVNPFLKFTIKGVIWYQGESNADTKDDAELYEKLLPTLIANWRTNWKNPTLPFYFAQLANFREKSNYDEHSNWALLRQAQWNASKIPNTGMAVLADIGNAHDIHPKNKQEVGRRLGLIARNKIYNQPIVFNGPIVKSYKIKKNTVILNFDVQGKNFMMKNTESSSSFYISGKDHIYYPATVKVVGNSVELKSSKVNNPAMVRYAWSDNPDLNIYDMTGLPGSPFQLKLLK